MPPTLRSPTRDLAPGLLLCLTIALAATQAGPYLNLSPLLLALLIGAGRNVYQAVQSGEGLYSASLILVMVFVLMIVYWYARVFALRAQDRAIRAEENFRHYLLTGKTLDSRLRMSQIIALRFAPDEEFPALAKKAVDEGLSAKAIKQAIQNWKGDYYRV